MALGRIVARGLVSACVLAVPAAACAQDAPQAPQVPWPVQLGYRTAALERSWPIVNQVVLVPDGRTYLDEISKWSESARWPVLIEDDLYARALAM